MVLQVSACGLPVSEEQKGKFDLVLVTDNVHSLSARIQTLQTLLALLDKDTVSPKGTKSARYTALGLNFRPLMIFLPSVSPDRNAYFFPSGVHHSTYLAWSGR